MNENMGERMLESECERQKESERDIANEEI